MAKTRKVQVTLEPDQYELLREVAEREGKALAAVVRESIVRYCVEPAERRRRRRALETLSATEAPVPDEYREWEREYAGRKAAEEEVGMRGSDIE